MGQLGWAQGLDRAKVERAIRILDSLDRDSRAFHAQLGQELGPADDTMPEADLVSQDGRMRAFSDKALLKALQIQEQKLRKEFGQMVQPLQAAHQEAQQAAQREQFVQQGRESVRTALQHLASFPHWKDNEAAISKEMQEIPRETVEKFGVVTAMYMAHSQWLTKHLPQMIQDAITKDRESLKKVAAAGSGQVVPSGSPAQGSTKSPSNVSELAAHMAKLAGASA